MPHVLKLKDCFLEERETYEEFTPPLQFCQLLKLSMEYDLLSMSHRPSTLHLSFTDSQFRVLCETGAFSEVQCLRDVNSTALCSLEEGKCDLKSIADLMLSQAILDQSFGNVDVAIELCKQAHELLKQFCTTGIGNPLANSYQAMSIMSARIAHCYNTANDHSQAMLCLPQSEAWWKSVAKGDQDSATTNPTFLRENTTRCKMYLGDFVGAKQEIDGLMETLKSEPENWHVQAK
jgi:hypothetical protein